MKELWLLFLSPLTWIIKAPGRKRVDVTESINVDTSNAHGALSYLDRYITQLFPRAVDRFPDSPMTFSAGIYIGKEEALDHLFFSLLPLVSEANPFRHPATGRRATGFENRLAIGLLRLGPFDFDWQTKAKSHATRYAQKEEMKKHRRRYTTTGDSGRRLVMCGAHRRGDFWSESQRRGNYSNTCLSSLRVRNNWPRQSR